MPTNLIGVQVKGYDTPVHEGPGHIVDGIAFGHLGDAVIVTITRGGRALSVKLRGNAIDMVGGCFAEAVVAVNAVERDGRETMQ